MDEQEKNSKMKIASNLVWKKMPIKYKAITIVAAAAIIFIFVFLLLIIAPLISTGIIKSDDISSGYRGSSAYGAIKKDVYWWPIGSTETEEQNGFLLAKGDPKIITISNNYSESIFFEYLSTLDKKYIFINTKEILSKNLENSERDIFYADDTHWSYKASNNIIESDAFNNIFNKGEQ